MRRSLVAALLLLSGPAVAQIAPPSPIAPIAAEQALSKMGENVTVAGTAHIHDAETRQGLYIDLDGRGRAAPFAGFIAAGDEAQFKGLKALEGRMVAISGVVQLRHGIPIIILSSPTQIRTSG